MKMVLTFILGLALYEASALEIKVQKMTLSAGFTERWDLKTSLNEKVVLDCQSFVQGLLFGPVGENAIMLQEWECEELKVDMKKSIKRFKQHCVEIDVDRSVMDSHQTCR